MFKLIKTKRVDFNFSKLSLKFDFSQKVFSSAQVDRGTKALLNSLRKNENITYEKILDLGCGHGVMASFLKKQNSSSEVHAVDRDSLALNLTEHNANLNNLKIKVYPSLDYQNVKDKFDLIVCNYPAKAGKNVLKRFVYNSSEHLTKKGIFAIVIVKELNEEFQEILNEKININFMEKKQGYLIYHLNFKKEINYSEDPYFRDEIKYKDYALEVARSIPEFESPSYATEAMIEILHNLKNIKNISIYNPSQGHIALEVYELLKPERINLISRDLLSLEYSKKNLMAAGFSNIFITHNYLVKENSELLIWSPDKKERDCEIYQKLKIYKNKFKKIIISGRKVILERIIRRYKLIPSIKKDVGGYSAIILEQSPSAI